MSDIIFNDENNLKYKSGIISDQVNVSGMVKFLISKGVVKNEKQASVFLIILVLISFSASVFLIYNSFFKKIPVPPITIEEELLINQMPRQIQ